jgi:hypothetical protein
MLIGGHESTRITTELLSGFRLPDSFLTATDISAHSQQRRLTYQSLLQESRWEELSEACIGDIRRGHSDVLVLIAAIREARAVRTDAARTIHVLRMIASVIGTIERPDESMREIHLCKPEPMRKLFGKVLFPTTVFAAAHDLVRLQSAALQCLIEADLSQNVLRGQQSARMRTSFAEFWQSGEARDGEIRALADGLAGYKGALEKYHRRVYLATLSDRRSLPVVLSDLIGWIARNVRGLLTLQSSISFLAAKPAEPNDKKTVSLLTSLAIDCGILVREVVATYLASLVSVLSLNGAHHLHHNVKEALAGASTTPLHGMFASGKRTSVSRLHRLPNGMHVRVEGTLYDARFVTSTGGESYIATLRDALGSDPVTIVAPVNLLSHGLADGCHARVSGYYRKSGSARYGRRHVEVEELRVRELYAQDIWKVSFLELAHPYFSNWPSNCHVGFEMVGATTSSTLLDESSSAGARMVGVCVSELAALDKQKLAYAAAAADLVKLTNNYFTKVWMAWAGCLIGFTKTPITEPQFITVGCGTVFTNMFLEYETAMAGIKKCEQEKAALDKAKQALDDCVIKTFSGSIGRPAASGSLGGPTVDWHIVEENDGDGWAPDTEAEDANGDRSFSDDEHGSWSFPGVSVPSVPSLPDVGDRPDPGDPIDADPRPGSTSGVYV